MITIRKAIIVAASASALALGLAAPATADFPDDPCPLSVAFLCSFLPIAPDLDHNIDLTQQSGIINGQPVPQIPTQPAPPDTGG